MKKLLLLSLVTAVSLAQANAKIAKFDELLYKSDAAGAMNYFKHNILGKQDRKTALQHILKDITPAYIDTFPTAKKALIEILNDGGSVLIGEAVESQWYEWMAVNTPSIVKLVHKKPLAAQEKSQKQHPPLSAIQQKSAQPTQQKKPMELFKESIQNEIDSAAIHYSKLSQQQRIDALNWLLNTIVPTLSKQEAVAEITTLLNNKAINADLRTLITIAPEKGKLSDATKTWLGDHGVHGFEEFETPPAPPADPAD
jgi:hypothetical protein